MEWVGPLKMSPCHSKRPGAFTSCDATPSEIATSRSSSRPHTERRQPRVLRSGPTMRFSEPRLRLPISATRFRHAGTPASRRSSSVRGCRPCPPLLFPKPCDLDELKSHAVCRSSPHRPSRATCRTFRCREQGLWSGLLGEEGSSPPCSGEQHGPVIPERRTRDPHRCSDDGVRVFPSS